VARNKWTGPGLSRRLSCVPELRLCHGIRDAGAYITSLPLKIHDAQAWQSAMHVLIQAADFGGPMEFARLGMVQALNPKQDPVYQPAKKDPVWRNNYKLVRDR
jgi:hypothetical protein